MTSSKRVILKIAGDEVDITEFPPLTIGDKKALKRDGMSFVDMMNMSPDDEAKLILFFLRKVRPTTTMDEVDALSMKAGQDVITHGVRCSSEVDSPLSPSSTPSVGITGGANAS